MAAMKLEPAASGPSESVKSIEVRDHATHVATVQLPGLCGLSYIGVLGLCGTQRSDQASSWLLYGKRTRRVVGTCLDTTVCFTGPRPHTYEAAKEATVLDADSGAHNFCVIDDSGTQERLQHAMGPDCRACTAFAVGGQYLAPDRPRFRAGYEGIYLYALRCSSGRWNAQRCKLLVAGDHPGVTELRPKCGGYGEFDGQSALVFFGSSFRLFTRANACVDGGYRCVQLAQSRDLVTFSPFRLATFPTIPANANIYFAHPYVLPGALYILMPISFEPPDVQRSGIYVAVASLTGDDDLIFGEPVRVFHSDTCANRTFDVNAAGAMISADGNMLLLLHRWVRSRMQKELWDVAPPECLEWWTVDLAALFSEKEASSQGDAATFPPSDSGGADGKAAGALAPSGPSVGNIEAAGALAASSRVETEIVAHARARRAEKLRQLGESVDAQLSFDESQKIWREWQDHWIASRSADEPSLQNARGKFGSYIHKNVGPGGEKVIRLVLQTGCSEGRARELISADSTTNAVPSRTQKMAQPTASQRAAKSRRRLAYVDNQATLYFREHGLCERCGDDNDGIDMRSCNQCGRAACNCCLPPNRLHCFRCPAIDDMRGNDLGSRCQKCAWEYDDDLSLRQCGYCLLALCEWCRLVDGDACRRSCPALTGPKTKYSGEQSQGRQAHWCAQRLLAGHVLRRARSLSAEVGATKSSTAMERLLYQLQHTGP